MIGNQDMSEFLFFGICNPRSKQTIHVVYLVNVSNPAC